MHFRKRKAEKKPVADQDISNSVEASTPAKWWQLRSHSKQKDTEIETPAREGKVIGQNDGACPSLWDRAYQALG